MTNLDVFVKAAYDYFDDTNPFTEAYKAFYGEEEGIPANVITICEFVRDTYAYYGANLLSTVEQYQAIYNDLCVLYGMNAKVELTEMMAKEAAQVKADREKTERSRPLWNALKY